MKPNIFLKRAILTELLLILAAISVNGLIPQIRRACVIYREEKEKEDFIKWLEFTPTCEALSTAYQIDFDTAGQEKHIEWISLLAYAAAKTGGDFSAKSIELMQQLAQNITSGETTLKRETEKLKYYSFYEEAYQAVLGGMVGDFETSQQGSTELKWQKQYGLKAFSPIAKGFDYSDYDDFGTSRSFGYSRPHLGHDMMGQIGTPLICIESGTVEALGWNRYGGWRIGIRSFDQKRYYYYAHMRQNYPYQKCLEEGSIVTAGDVIGYMGHTGYSDKENVNNIEVTHLHVGLQIIFDESQKDSDNEIWIDCYPLMQFLRQHQSETKKRAGSKEWDRVVQMRDPACNAVQ